MISPKLVFLLALVVYFIGYRFYSKFLADKIFGLRRDAITPAHAQNDGIDYVPTPPYVLLGHHYASIAGLGPILGPAVAVIWGWLPALLWVVFGTVLIGAVHDFAALVLSARAKGMSIGTITEHLMGKRAKLLFLLIIFFLVSLAMGVFVLVLGFLFSPDGFPSVFAPTTAIMAVAMAMGYLSFKKGVSIKYLAAPAFILVLGALWWGQLPSSVETFGLGDNTTAPTADDYKIMILGYAFAASILPVWLLLQARDFLNSLLLYLGMVLLYLGFLLSDLSFSAPAIYTDAENAPSVFPFVFIVIACGAISGFHSLVSSGTTAKQLSNETHARSIGYGGMIGESLLGLIAVFATTTVFSSEDQWLIYYGDWSKLSGLAIKVKIFVDGGAQFLHGLHVPLETGKGLLAFIVVSFALTSLDSGTRLLRYNVEELGSFLPDGYIRKIIQNRYFSSLAAVAAIGFFAYFKVDGVQAGKALWVLFGTTNQLLGSLALFLASVYLYSRGKNPLYTMVPMLFVLISTVVAMTINFNRFQFMPGGTILAVITVFLLIMTVWLLFEGILAVNRYRKNKTQQLDII